MKKLVLGILITGSLMSFAAENVVIDKEVTGINKETIEKREVINKEVSFEQKEVNASEVRTSSEKLKNTQENLNVKNSDDSLKKELASDMSTGNSFWKYILGVVGIVAIAIAL